MGDDVHGQPGEPQSAGSTPRSVGSTFGPGARHRRRPPTRQAGAALAAIVVLALGAAACSSSPHSVGAPQALSSAGVDDGITVTGSGQVDGTPDTLTASFGVLAHQPSVSAAIAGAAATAATVVATLKAHGVVASDIQTQNYSVSQSFDTVNGRQVPNGYSVGETLVAKLHQLSTAGALIDAVSAAGGPAVSVQDVAFSLEDNKQLLSEARAMAYGDAKAQAQQLSGLSGRRLGPAAGIQLATNPEPIYAAQGLAASTASSPAAVTQLEPGSVSTTVQVTVRFTLT